MAFHFHKLRYYPIKTAIKRRCMCNQKCLTNCASLLRCQPCQSQWQRGRSSSSSSRSCHWWRSQWSIHPTNQRQWCSFMDKKKGPFSPQVTNTAQSSGALPHTLTPAPDTCNVGSFCPNPAGAVSPLRHPRSAGRKHGSFSPRGSDAPPWTSPGGSWGCDLQLHHPTWGEAHHHPHNHNKSGMSRKRGKSLANLHQKVFLSTLPGGQTGYPCTSQSGWSCHSSGFWHFQKPVMVK